MNTSCSAPATATLIQKNEQLEKENTELKRRLRILEYKCEYLLALNDELGERLSARSATTATATASATTTTSSSSSGNVDALSRTTPDESRDDYDRALERCLTHE